MVAAREAFKQAFLNTCQAAGLDATETGACIDTAISLAKQGGLTDLFTEPVKRFAGAVADRLPGALELGYFGLPIAGGAAAGYGLAKLNDLNNEDPGEIRTREEIDSLKRLSQEMTIKNRLRESNRPTKARSPLVR